MRGLWISGVLICALTSAHGDDAVPTALKPDAAPDLKSCIDLLAQTPVTMSYSGWTRRRTTTLTFDRATRSFHVRSTWSHDYFGTNFDIKLDFASATLHRNDSWVGNYDLVCDKATNESPCYYNLADLHKEIADVRSHLPAGVSGERTALDCTDRLADQFSREARSRLSRPFGDATVASDENTKHVTPATPGDDLLQPARKRRTFTPLVR